MTGRPEAREPRAGLDGDALVVTLRPLEAASCLRRTYRLPVSEMREFEVRSRRELESRIENRILGVGTGVGRRRPGRRRAGRFLGRPVVGEQLWAVDRHEDVLVVEFGPGSDFARCVLGVPDPAAFATALRVRIETWPG